MEEHMGNSNKIIIDSFHDNKDKVINAKVADLNKKRKLENEQLFFPLSKHKSGYRSTISEHDQPLAEKSDENEVIHEPINKGKRLADLADETSELELEFESSKDSNSFVGGSNYPMSEDAEKENMLEAEYPPQQTLTHAPSSTSSGTCSSNSLKDTLHSLHNRKIIKEATVGKEDQVLVAGIGEPSPPNLEGQLQFRQEDQVLVAGIGEPSPPNLEGQLQFRQGAQFSVDQLQNFEEHADPICVAYQVDGLEQCLDEDLQDIMLYSNGPSQKEQFVLSSGRWSIDKEARQRSRPPTIDQEFAEYFSALML